MSAVKRLMESLDDLDRLRTVLVDQGADPAELRSLEEHAAMLRSALGVA